jgi:hypothetical protein
MAQAGAGKPFLDPAMERLYGFDDAISIEPAKSGGGFLHRLGRGYWVPARHSSREEIPGNGNQKISAL